VEEQFDRDGFAIVDLGFPSDLIEDATSFVRAHFEIQSGRPIQSGIRIQDARKGRQFAVSQPS
jgi:hypothetical protein